MKKQSKKEMSKKIKRLESQLRRSEGPNLKENLKNTRTIERLIDTIKDRNLEIEELKAHAI